MTADLFLLAILCIAATTAYGASHLRAAKEVTSIPITLQATIAPPLSGPHRTIGTRIAQCLETSFQSLQGAARGNEQPVTLLTGRATMIAKTEAPNEPRNPKEEDDGVFQTQSHDTLDPDMLPPDAREDESINFLQALADWIQAFFVRLGILETSSSITVTPSASTSSSDQLEDFGCIWCPDDDDDGLQSVLHNAEFPSSAPSANHPSSNVGCNLCPERDDDHTSSDLHGGDGIAIQVGQEEEYNGNRRLHDRATWTVEGVFEGPEQNTNEDLWIKFEMGSYQITWAGFFCDCINGSDQGIYQFAGMPRDSSSISICQIHVYDAV